MPKSEHMMGSVVKTRRTNKLEASSSARISLRFLITELSTHRNVFVAGSRKKTVPPAEESPHGAENSTT